MANVKNIAFNNTREDGGHFPADSSTSIEGNFNKRAFHMSIIRLGVKCLRALFYFANFANLTASSSRDCQQFRVYGRQK